MAESEERGPTWWDVQVAMAEMEKGLGCVAWYEIRRVPGVEGRRGKLLVRACLSGLCVGSPKDTVWWRGYEWPCMGHRTMPGLLLRALHEIEDEMLNRIAVVERSSQTALT